MNNIEKKIREVIEQNIQLAVSVDQIGLEDDLSAFGLDSASSIKMIVGIEAEFGIEFDDEDLIVDNFMNLKSLLSYIERKMIE